MELERKVSHRSNKNKVYGEIIFNTELIYDLVFEYLQYIVLVCGKCYGKLASYGGYRLVYATFIALIIILFRLELCGLLELLVEVINTVSRFLKSRINPSNLGVELVHYNACYSKLNVSPFIWEKIVISSIQNSSVFMKLLHLFASCFPSRKVFLWWRDAYS